MEEIPSNRKNSVLRLLLLLTAASAAMLWSQPSIGAQESPPIVVSQSITLLEFVRQVSREQGNIIAAEVADQRRLHGQVRAGRYTLTAALEEIQRQFAASGYLRKDGAICFLSGVAPAKPALQMSGSFVLRREQVARVNRLLESLRPGQLEELRSNKARISFQHLDGEQQADVMELKGGPGVIVDGVPFAQNPKAVITMQFRTTMTIGTPDGGYKRIQIGDSSLPLQGTSMARLPGNGGRAGKPSATEAQPILPNAQTRDADQVAELGELPAQLEQEFGRATVVNLPHRESSTYRLRELAVLTTATCRREVIVDRRTEDRQLLLVSPTGSVPTVGLLSIMGRTLHLHWRKVDELAFLTYFPDDVQDRTTREEREKLRQDQTKVLDGLSEKLPGAVPITTAELFSGQQAWSNLTQQERSRLVQLGSFADKDDQRWLGGFFRSGGVVNDSTFYFGVDLLLRATVEGSGSLMAVPLGR